MSVVVKGKISRNAAYDYDVRIQRVEGVTADSSLTADSVCWTADGRIICIPAVVAEAAGAFDGLDATRIAGSAVINADLAEAAAASDLADAVSNIVAAAIEGAAALDSLDAVTDVAANAVEAASALDSLDAVSDVAADAIESAGALDALDAVADFAAAVAEAAGAFDEVVAAIGAQVLSGTVDEAADALDQLDAAVISAEVPVDVVVGRYYPPRRPLPVIGVGDGILPQLEGEAHGVVGAVGRSAAQVFVRAHAAGAIGQAGNATVVLKTMSVAGKGAVGARGRGEGTIMKFSGSATGRHDDDEAAVIAILLAA